MLQEIIDANAEQRTRLTALAGRLTDDDLAHPLSEGWTVAAALAHLAFWDRRAQTLAADAPHTGVRSSPIDSDVINQASLPLWRALPPRLAVDEAIAAATAADAAVAALPDALAEEILAANAFPLDRAHHRRIHLDEIDAALGR